jgi:hypothetical protein
MTQAYTDFLTGKFLRHDAQGFPTAPDDLPAYLFPFQRDLVAFALTKGRAALFADTGLGKTRMELAWADEVSRNAGGPVMIFAPLAVAQQTVREGLEIGVPVHYTRSGHDLSDGVNITNYEMLEHFTPADFVGVVLDESSILKSFTGKIRTALIEAFQTTPYRLACTATPAPNDYTEIGNHSEFLGVLSRVEMLATFFVHDGGDTSVWRLKGHAQTEFWGWVSSWAAAIRKPADLGYENAGYDLPELTVHHHRLEVARKDDQLSLFVLPALTLTDQRAAKKDSLQERCATVAALVAAEPDEPWLIWCELNEEGDLLERLIPGAVQVAGSDTREQKEAAMLGFARGDFRVLVSKPSLCGFGMNWQHAARMAFAHVTHSYEQFYQAIRRCYRFGQQRPVQVHAVYAETESAIVENLQRKEREAQEMTGQMVAHMAFENNGRASTRDLEAYRPTVHMTLPAWLRGGAA